MAMLCYDLFITFFLIVAFPTTDFFNGIKVFAEFPTCVTENSAYPGSVIVDCILLLDSGVNVDNSAFHVLFHDLSIDLAISSTI